MSVPSYDICVCILAALCMITMLALGAMNPRLGVWACRHMGWHLAPKEPGFDGCSFVGKCPRCGKPVLQDSQGNWF